VGLFTIRSGGYQSPLPASALRTLQKTTLCLWFNATCRSERQHAATHPSNKSDTVVSDNHSLGLLGAAGRVVKQHVELGQQDITDWQSQASSHGGWRRQLPPQRLHVTRSIRGITGHEEKACSSGVGAAGREEV